MVNFLSGQTGRDIKLKKKRLKGTNSIFKVILFSGPSLLQMFFMLKASRAVLLLRTELPRERGEEEMQSKDEPANVAECRDSFIIWLANFTMTSRRPDPDLIK